MKTPYLSIIIANRNDDYAGVTERFQFMIEFLGLKQKKYPDLFEVIISEWNPPVNRPSIENQYNVEKHLSNYKIVTTSPKEHKKISKNGKAPFYEYAAKTTGAKLASGEFILITNTECFFSESLWQFFNDRKLKHEHLYLCCRPDFYWKPNSACPSKIEQYAQTHIVRKNNDAFIYTPFAAWAFLKHKITGRHIATGYLKGKDLGDTYEIPPNNYKPIAKRLLVFLNMYNTLQETALPKKIQNTIKLSISVLKRLFSISNLNLIAPSCPGDFTLMSSHDWLKVNYYPIRNHDNMGLDSDLVYSAISKGITPTIFHEKKFSVFHIDHEIGQVSKSLRKEETNRTYFIQKQQCERIINY